MKATTKIKNESYAITFEFEKGEKCFCCSKVFNEKTKTTQRFSSQKEYDEYISALRFYYNVQIENPKNK
jgi:hypothetical protein